MKTYTWNTGNISEGISLTNDEKLGQIIFLGESGRGRRYEKVSLGRRNPADEIDGRILETNPVKITLPARNGKSEKSFFVLERPSKNVETVLMRINTQWCYTKGTTGRWVTVAGEPETLISGYGAHGIAGRIGNWDDGLVVMKSGDVLKIKPEGGHKTSAYALWLENSKPVTATWKDYENLQTVAKAQKLIEKAEEQPESLDVVYGQMPAFTWSGGNISKGMKVSKGATGSVIAVGESGRGRSLVEFPIVGSETGETVEEAAVVKLDEKVIPARYSWEESQTKVIYGLTQTDATEKAFLVRVSTGHGYTRRGSGAWEAWKGNPTLLGQGHGADGTAGRIGSWDDGIWVLREGDVLWARPSGGNPSYAIFVESGELKTQRWITWKAEDGRHDPEFYASKGTAPWGHVPIEWVGQVVIVQTLDKQSGRYGGYEPVLNEGHIGELISVSESQIVLNLGWDGQDRHDVTVSNGTWVKLERDKQVRRLEGEALEKRQQIRAETEELRGKAITATQQGYFNITETSLRE